VAYTHIIDPAISDGYGMIAANAAGVRPSPGMAVYARRIAARQEADGVRAAQAAPENSKAGVRQSFSQSGHLPEFEN